MENQSALRKKILNITFIALFAAISYISLMLFFFPFGQMYIHFGNLVVVVASLLVGGWQGGLAGSIGMGLYDIFNGHADSSPKTFLLKFLIGLTVGLVYNFFKSRKKYPVITLLISGIVALGIGISLMIYNLTVLGKIGVDIAVLIALFILIGVFCIIFSALKTKFSQQTASAIAGATCGMTVNIVGELLWKTVQFSLAGSSVSAAFSASLLAQGSTLINAAISIIGGVALFKALEKPFKKILSK